MRSHITWVVACCLWLGQSWACGSGLRHVVEPTKVAGLDGSYAENIEAARNDVSGAEKALGDAQETMKLAEAEYARADYHEALVTEREAGVAMAQAELWVKRAKFELVKLEMLIKSKGLKDVKTTERLLEFKAQLADREKRFLETQRAHADALKEREERRLALNTTLRNVGLAEVADPDDPSPEAAPPAPATPPPSPPSGATSGSPAGTN